MVGTQSLTEKYRPQTLSDLIGQTKEVDLLKRFVVDYHAGKVSMPNLLMTGPPGLGKTTAARALCRDLFGEGWQNFTKEMNASDDRGIDVVRGEIKRFAQTSTMGQLINVILLDECDNLTGDAQSALRVTMEAYSHIRFILCCNYPNKVLQPLIDRCMVLRFKPVPPDEMLMRLEHICREEEIDASNLASVIDRSKGSMRKALNLLGGVDEEEKGDAGEAIDLLYKGKLLEAEGSLVKTLRSQPSTSEVFLSCFNRMVELGRGNKELFVLGEYEYRVLGGANLELQARCMLRHLAHMGATK